MQPTAFHFDHVFLATGDPATAERVLTDAGLVFNRRGAHPGQGTANACASLANIYLELLFARDEAELRSDLVAPLALDERMNGGSPFGIALRCDDLDRAARELDAWDYRPSYLPPGRSLPILTRPHATHEPLIFLSPFPASTAVTDGAKLTGVRITIPDHATALSVGVQWLSDHGVLTIERGDHHLMELLMDGAQQPHRSIMPTLPLAW